MSLKRKGIWLAALLVGWLAGLSASAQGLRDADLFAPAEPASYGGGVRPNEGFFFTYDALLWWATAPERASFGIDTNLVSPRNVFWGPEGHQSFTQGTTMDTSFLETMLSHGQRIELGHINDHAGWLFSYMRLHQYFQDQTLSGVQSFFIDREWGAENLEHLVGVANAPVGPLVNLPVVFSQVTLSDTMKVWGTEFDFLYRMHPGHRGGIFEWIGGVRYLQFTETFGVAALGDGPPAHVLADTIFTTNSVNNIIGPQIGLRWFKSNDRWQFSTEGRFLAGFNSQSTRQNGVVGSRLSIPPTVDQAGVPISIVRNPVAMTATSVDYATHTSTFSPVGELRVEGKYQLTKSVGFRAGWNGLFIPELARPSRMVNYELGLTNVLGILSNKNHDSCFLQGVELGIEINR